MVVKYYWASGSFTDAITLTQPDRPVIFVHKVIRIKRFTDSANLLKQDLFMIN